MPTIAARLVAGGYLPVPIKPGSKRCIEAGWQHARYTADELHQFKRHGLGLLTGQGTWPLAAFDIDATTPGLAQSFVDWCRANLGYAPERVGRAPKTLLVYRAAEAGWRKSTGAWYEDMAGDRHRLEILGDGQQFVAYAIHPDTQRAYEWVDAVGGLVEWPARDLPVVTRAQIEAAHAAFEGMAQAAGLARVKPREVPLADAEIADADDPLMATPVVGMTLADARQHLTHIDREDYDDWLHAGMALHHEFNGSASALALWDEWSSEGSNYAGTDDLAHRWRGFGARRGARITARWLIKAGREARHAADRLARRSSLTTARAAIGACEDSIDLLDTVAREAGVAANGDAAIRAELEGLLRDRFHALTGIRVPIATVRQAMGFLPRAATTTTTMAAGTRYANTEFGISDRLVDRYGAGLMYVPDTAQWYTWTGVYWQRATQEDVHFAAQETIRTMHKDVAMMTNDDDRAAFLRHCAQAQAASVARHAVELSQARPEVMVRAAALDAQRHLLGVGNGMVDLTTGRLCAPDPDAHITRVTTVAYNPDAECPLFEQTVQEALSDDADMAAFLQRIIGYALLGDPVEDKMVIPFGAGANGKSTIFGAIRDVLGQHAAYAAADTFLASSRFGGGANAGGTRADIIHLAGSRLCFVGEPDEGNTLRSGLVKSMTGGEALAARAPYAREVVEVEPTWTVIMPTNHKPIVLDDTRAIWRRILPIPFLRQFEGATKDVTRAARLKREAQGILTWCVRGTLAYRAEGLEPYPTAIEQAREDYKQDMDLLAEWLGECCEIGAQYSATNAELWASWRAFAMSRGEDRYVPSAKALGRRLATKGFPAFSRKEDGATYRGHAGLRVVDSLAV